VNYRLHHVSRNLTQLVGLAAGLGFLFTGWAIYSNNGFDSKWLFFIGFLMVPTGLLVLGNTLIKTPAEEET